MKAKGYLDLLTTLGETSELLRSRALDITSEGGEVDTSYVLSGHLGTHQGRAHVLQHSGPDAWVSISLLRSSFVFATTNNARKMMIKICWMVHKMCANEFIPPLVPLLHVTSN